LLIDGFYFYLFANLSTYIYYALKASVNFSLARSLEISISKVDSFARSSKEDN